MAHVPDKFVLGRIKDTVQRNGQFDDAKIRTEMSTTLGKSGDQFLANFAGEFLKLRQREFFDVLRSVHHVEVCAHKLFFGQINRFQLYFARHIFFQLLNLQLRLGQFFMDKFSPASCLLHIFAKSVSNGKSSDSIASTRPSSFFKASSNGGVFGGIISSRAL